MATDATGTQYKIKFQYDTSVFMVKASFKGGQHPFDPCQIDLSSIHALVAFYHACLGFPMKNLWLEAIKAASCDTFTGLIFSNMACYCPNTDETILGHLGKCDKMSDQPNHRQHPAPVCPQLSRPHCHRPMLCRRCFSSANYLLMTLEGSRTSALGQSLCHDCLSHGGEPHSTTSVPDESRHAPHSCLQYHCGTVDCAQAFC
jgi:hypothetical protein